MSTPWRWRTPSYVAKKNVRPRQIGPPSDPPNWLRSNGCGSVVVNSKKLLASSASFRKNSKASPRNRSEPERVTMLTTAPETWPYSALNVEVSTLNSSMLAIGGSKMSDPNVRLLVVTPLTMKETASSRLPAVLNASVPSPRIGVAREPGLRRRDRPGHQQRKIDEMAAVERDLLDGLWPTPRVPRRSSPDRAVAASARTTTASRRVSTVELKVADQRAADIERQRVDAFGSESWSLGRHLVRAGRDGRHVIAALTVARGRAGEPDGGIAHHDRRARNGRAGWIEHATL